MKADPFESCKLLLDRAAPHGRQFETLSQEWLRGCPYETFTERQPEGEWDTIRKVRLTAPFPPELCGLAFDYFSNLRAALDHAVYASTEALGRHNPKYVCFPFGASRIDVEKELRAGKARHVFPPIAAVIVDECRPYEGGNELLVALNRTRNVTLHRMLVPLGIAAHGTLLAPVANSIPGVMRLVSPRVWDREKNEMTVLETRGVAQTDYVLKPLIEVVIGEIEDVSGHSSVATWKAMGREARRATNLIERAMIGA